MARGGVRPVFPPLCQRSFGRRLPSCRHPPCLRAEPCSGTDQRRWCSAIAPDVGHESPCDVRSNPQGREAYRRPSDVPVAGLHDRSGVDHPRSHHWVYGGFLLLTSGFVIYALVALIGVRTSFEDMGLDRVVSMLRSRVVRRAGLEPPVVGGSVSTTIER